jgi:starch-binding outer membrane protein, SusD/RagB family
MKLKKIFVSLCLSLMLVTMACESILEVEPEFSKDGSQIFTKIEDYDYALTGAYSLFKQVGYYASGGQTTSSWGNLPDMMADNLVRTAEDLANWQTQVNWTYTADENDLEVAWLAAYTIIGQANLALRGIDNFAESNPEDVNRIKGQALAIRGMVHFDLLRYWGESYDRSSSALGIPYVEAVDIELKPSRLSVSETYDKIFTDLELAETLLADVEDINASGRAYIDVVVVQAILARVNLYAKDYAKAESYATSVIDAIGLASQTDFVNVWRDGSTEEVIWSVAFNLGEGVPSAGVHLASSNRNRFKPSLQLEDMYDQINDIRFSTYFASRTLSGTPRRILSKFYARAVAPPTAGDNLVNWKVFRTGEMYLIRAEARALQSGKEVLGLDDLNELRSARITGYTPEVLTGNNLIIAIADERRKELVGEGHRWFDLKRTTKIIDRPASDEPLTATPLSLASGAREWTWPIPTSEINNNENIRPQQTTGY